VLLARYNASAGRAVGSLHENVRDAVRFETEGPSGCRLATTPPHGGSLACHFGQHATLDVERPQRHQRLRAVGQRRRPSGDTLKRVTKSRGERHDARGAAVENRRAAGSSTAPAYNHITQVPAREMAYRGIQPWNFMSSATSTAKPALTLS